MVLRGVMRLKGEMERQHARGAKKPMLLAELGLAHVKSEVMALSEDEVRVQVDVDPVGFL